MSQFERKVIYITRLERRGDGKDDDPVRIIEQWWAEDGEPLFEYDPHTNVVTRW